MQARYYSADIARFGSVDPVGFLDTGLPGYFNRYVYTWNDPINNLDPDGKACAPCAAYGVYRVGKATYGGYKAYRAAQAARATASLAVGITAAEVTVGGPLTSDSAEPTRPLGDLEPIDGPRHSEPRPELQELTEDELMGTVTDRADGEKGKLKGDRKIPSDGNGRIREMKDRGFSPDTEIPVEELPDDNDDIFPELE